MIDQRSRDSLRLCVSRNHLAARDGDYPDAIGMTSMDAARHIVSGALDDRTTGLSRRGEAEHIRGLSKEANDDRAPFRKGFTPGIDFRIHSE